MKKILFITGTRADFGKIKPLIKLIENLENFDFKIFVTGMHLLEKYGSTYLEVQRTFPKNIFLFKNQNENEHEYLDKILSNTITGLRTCLDSYNPDLILVHGDRVEALAAASVGSLNNILTGHIEGGEVSGTIDDLIRHSVSKLSHVHFVSNEDSKNRLIQMGEINKNIYVIGSPDIDLMMSDDLPALDFVKKHYEIEFLSYSIFCYHPVTTELENLDFKVNQIYQALEEIDENFIFIHPNNDPGTKCIMKNLEKLKEKGNFLFFPSLRHEYFLALLKNANCIVGNSSSGIREAPIFSTPTINIGSRQNGRYFYESILNTKEEKKEIINSFKKISSLKNLKPSKYFGEGKSIEKFYQILSKEDFWNVKIQKIFVDNNTSL